MLAFSVHGWGITSKAACMAKTHCHELNAHLEWLSMALERRCSLVHRLCTMWARSKQMLLFWWLGATMHEGALEAISMVTTCSCTLSSCLEWLSVMMQWWCECSFVCRLGTIWVRSLNLAFSCINQQLYDLQPSSLTLPLNLVLNKELSTL